MTHRPKRSSWWQNRSLRWVSMVLMAAVLILFLRHPAAADTAKHYTEIEFEPLPELTLPDYERYQLANGMLVYLIEDHQLPLIQGSATIRTGSRLEPSSKVGLAALVGTVMRSGGTEQHSADRLNQLLEGRAATIEANIRLTNGSANFNTLTEDFEMVLPLFAEVLRSPTFNEQQFQLAKQQQVGQIARRNDTPGEIAQREFRKLIYGEASPYARTEEYVTLDNITQSDLIDFYQTYVHPEQIILGIVGDFDPTEAKALIEKAFGDWQPGEKRPDLALSDVVQQQTKGVYLVDRPELTQSNILLGHLGGQYSSPDYPSLSLLNGILNGFGGRLFNELRSRRGLAYSVYGVWSAKYDYPGLFLAGGQTRTETTVPFIQVLKAEVEKIRNQPISAQELADAKNSILNSFVFKFENPVQTLSRLILYEYFGYPDDFIFQYQQGIQEVTIEDVQRVAQTYLQPEQLVTLVVGNQQAIQPPLSTLEEAVTTIDVSIPPPASETS